MSTRLLRLEIRYEQDVVLTRQRAKVLAGLLGFGDQDQTRIATAVSEIARNAFRYAGGGQAEFEVELEAPARLVIRIRDQGPGIADLPTVLSGGYRSSTGMGMGILGSRRLMDRFEIHSGPEGTVVELGQLFPPEVEVPPKQQLAQVVATLSRHAGESPAAMVQEQNQELIRLLGEVETRRTELSRLNQELEETNRGVVALYAELDEKAEALRRASELKSRFISHVSHEFRTPLNSILSLGRLLLERVDGPLTSEQERQVSFVMKSAQTLSELISDLLDLAKIEAGKTDLHPQRFEVPELFATLRGMMRPLLTSEAVALHFEAPGPLPALFTDEGKLSQILRNFISNALKFTEQGEVRVGVTRGAGGMLTFFVTDTGIGIAPEHHQRIFEEFAQVESPLQRTLKGTGLGLSLSAQLAGLLGGTLSVQSAPGKGSTFRVTLPAVHPQAEEIPDGLELRWREDAEGTVVLVLEEEPQPPAVYERLLGGSGFVAVPARTLAEARGLLERVRPAAVILEVQRQEGPGWELLSELQGHPATVALPVLVIAGHGDQENQAVALGAHAFHARPVERDWLLSTLRRVSQAPAPLPKILIVDDDEVSRYLLRRAIGEARVQVLEAQDGEEGLARIFAERPQLVFLDLVMPGKSGFEVLEALRADPRTRALPVVINTNKPLTPAERRRLESALEVLSKDQPTLGERAARVQQLLEQAGLGPASGRGPEAPGAPPTGR